MFPFVFADSTFYEAYYDVGREEGVVHANYDVLVEAFDGLYDMPKVGDPNQRVRADLSPKEFRLWSSGK